MNPNSDLTICAAIPNDAAQEPDRLSTTLNAMCETLAQLQARLDAQSVKLSTRIDRIAAAVTENQSATQTAAATERIDALNRKIVELETRNSELQRQIAAGAVTHVLPGASPGMAGASSFAPSGAEATTALHARRVGAEESLRKTLPPSTCALLAKASAGDIDSFGHLDVAALDKALSSLSLDQRIAVKAEMARAGLIA